MARNGTNILVGSLIGVAVAGTVAGAIIYANNRPKKRGLKYRFSDIKNRVEDLFEGIGGNAESFAANISDQACEWTEKAQDFVEWAQDRIESLNEPDNKAVKYGLLAGAVIIGLLGTTAAMLFSGKENERGAAADLLETVSKKVLSWRKMMENILEMAEDGICKVSEGINNVNNSISEMADYSGKKYKKNKNNTIRNIIDFATSGMQLWQSIKRGR